MFICTYTQPLTTSRYPVRGVFPLRLSTKALHTIDKSYIIKPQHYHHGQHNLMFLQGMKYLKMPYKIFVLNIMLLHNIYKSRALFLQNFTNANI